MVDYTAPYDALKTFKGLIHRQPLFINNRLDVESYHLTFLDKNGEALNDDIEVPAFLEQMTTILPAISNRQKALLTMPESWRTALFDIDIAGIEITLDIYGNPLPDARNRPFAFAGHANGVAHEAHTELLLIDLNSFDPASLTENLPHWRRRHQQLCATNVNALDQLNFCNSFAVDLLQGNFYTLPATADSHKMPPSAQTLMELLVKLQDPDIEADELALIINQDVTLSYKLLLLINSAFFGLPRQVSSTREAVVMLGQNKIKTWASLLCLSGLDHKPNELRNIAMIRARMCQLLAKFYKGHANMFFAAVYFQRWMRCLINRWPIYSTVCRYLMSYAALYWINKGRPVKPWKMFCVMNVVIGRLSTIHHYRLRCWFGPILMLFIGPKSYTCKSTTDHGN